MNTAKEFCKKYNNMIDELLKENIIDENDANLLKQRSSVICTMNINKDGNIANMNEFLQNIDNYDTKKVKTFFENDK